MNYKNLRVEYERRQGKDVFLVVADPEVPHNLILSEHTNTAEAFKKLRELKEKNQ
ncbi:hypothetical protein LCGC14_1444030 [marine sediment metagenome]|uniref:Uncharacterized protein n=1 Tax=marine sediment metagenome TaxID=412755 RepID=A0A0F9K620_9ZZZZ